MGNYIEYNEVEAKNVHEAKTENAKRSDVVSRGLQNSPGGYSVDHQGNVTENKTATVTQGIHSGQPGDVLKSARTQAGAPVEVITDDTIVSIKGVTATARSMAKSGFLQKHPDGSYSEVAPQKAAAPKKASKRVDPLPNSREQVQAIESIVGPQNAQRIMDRVVAAAGRGEGIEGVAKELADLGGVELEVTQSIVENVASDLDNRMTHDLIQGLGLTQPQAEAALDWMYSNLPKTHVSSMFAGALHGSKQALSAGWERYRLSSRKANNQ
jgi:hypothetical protein